ncbi:energy-coupled thiamine transporter ThiT [Metabacillus sp. 84]|uniref:energy-coupled thiamine transporter ThiT n=1 Tax=unclassified Metabacillus TaxID=2675274 RepID=UPI003CF6FDF2
MRNEKLLFMTEAAVLTAAALILDLLSGFFIKMPQGGSLSLGMIPVFLMSFRWGLKGGLLTGLLTGILQPVLSTLYYVHPVQVILDYPLPFMLVGMSGLFAGWVHNSLKNGKWNNLIAVMAAALFGSVLRAVSHIISGVFFFGSLAPEGVPVMWYSIGYSASWMVPSWILGGLSVWLIVQNSPSLIKPSDKKSASL